MATVTMPELDTELDQQTKRQPPYVVILHNDDLNHFGFVIAVLQKVFGYDREKCIKLTLEVHEEGRSIVWTGSLEVAELKADQIHSCGATPGVKGAQPLQTSLEPI